MGPQLLSVFVLVLSLLTAVRAQGQDYRIQFIKDSDPRQIMEIARQGDFVRFDSCFDGECERIGGHELYNVWMIQKLRHRENIKTIAGAATLPFTGLLFIFQTSLAGLLTPVLAAGSYQLIWKPYVHADFAGDTVSGDFREGVILTRWSVDDYSEAFQKVIDLTERLDTMACRKSLFLHLRTANRVEQPCYIN